MKWTLKILWGTIALLLFIGCAPQRGFYYSTSKISSDHNGELQVQTTPLVTEEPTANLADEAVPVDTSAFAAATQYANKLVAAPGKAYPMAGKANLGTEQAESALPEKQVNRKEVKVAPVRKAAFKHLVSKAPVALPVHTLSWVAFILSMVGLILLVITLSAAGPLLPFALSFLSFVAAMITSRKAISRIKKNPEQFSGKGLARAGFIISLIMLILYLAFIGYVLAFAGAF